MRDSAAEQAGAVKSSIGRRPTAVLLENHVELDEIAAARADLYALLASLMWRAPDAAGLRRLASMPGDGSEIGVLVRALAAAAETASAAFLARRHFDLFTGVGGGELMPYASYYLTGFLHERPLAEVRAEVERLGLARADGIAEPEDHAAFLCEVMAVMIRGGGDDSGFFARHLRPWIGRFFADLEKTGGFYGAVGALGRAFVEVEQAALALAD